MKLSLLILKLPSITFSVINLFEAKGNFVKFVFQSQLLSDVMNVLVFFWKIYRLQSWHVHILKAQSNHINCFMKLKLRTKLAQSVIAVLQVNHWNCVKQLFQSQKGFVLLGKELMFFEFHFREGPCESGRLLHRKQVAQEGDEQLTFLKKLIFLQVQFAQRVVKLNDGVKQATWLKVEFF